MKKQFLLFGFTLAFTSLSFISNASVWRVNGATGSGANYSTIQAAHDASTTMDNDTLYIEGSAFSVGPLSCHKKLVIIGTGYFLGENPQTQATLAPSFVDYIYFYSGSDGSKVTGISLNYIYFYGGNNILITRNYIAPGPGGYAIYNPSPVSNLIITQNYIIAYYGIYLTANSANNILITNNFISTPNGYYAISSGTNFSGIITNNVTQGGYVGVSYATIKNNIMITGYFTDNNNIVSNNICNGTQWPAATNMQNVDMSTVFAGLTGNSTDGQWKLKAGSPAIGYGEGGIDCGMYGGPYPYILSGMPNIPAIYYFNAPSLPTNSINVSIKAKSHN